MRTVYLSAAISCVLSVALLGGCSRPAAPKSSVQATFSREGERFVVDVTQPGFVLNDGLVRVFDPLGSEMAAAPLDRSGRATCVLAPDTAAAVVEVQLIGRPSDLIYLIFDDATGRAFPLSAPVTFNRECCVPGGTGSAAPTPTTGVTPSPRDDAPVSSEAASDDWKRWVQRAAIVGGFAIAAELTLLAIPRSTPSPDSVRRGV